jgi:hypothetical protein
MDMRSVLFLLALTAAAQQPQLHIVPQGTRIQIIDESMLPEGPDLRESINGPSLIRVPSWVKNPLGKYYLYFANHTGKYIRLAYADNIEGPWKIYAPGALHLEDQKVITDHMASPEALIDDARKEIVLFYHGQTRENGEKQGQHAAAAVSTDGLHFTPLNQIVGMPYLRVFRHGNLWYSLVGSGELGVTADLHKPFATVGHIIGDDIVNALYPRDLNGPRLPTTGRERFSIRHIGTDTEGDRLIVYFSCVGQMPEHIMATVVDTSGPVATWRAKGLLDVLKPELAWEGAAVPEAHSVGGKSSHLENSLRDPAVFRENGQAWLLYAAAGEHGLGIVKIRYEER